MKFSWFNSQKKPQAEENKTTTIEQFIGKAGTYVFSDTNQTYVIDKMLGAGGFADVYSVHNQHGQVFALKILRMWTILPEERSEILHRFEREYTCSKINSPYLVKSYDKGSHLGNPFFLMEYCARGSLSELIGQRFDESIYRAIAIQILKGLRDLHKEGIIHRDLKPVNVLFNSKGEALLTDFGISGYLKARLTVRDWLGHVKKIFGTVVYMPPEQLNAREAFLALGPVTDIFAFGVTMHEVLTGGELPFGPYTEIEEDLYLTRLTTGKWIGFDKCREYLPAPWPQIIEGCIQPNPLHRFQQAADILKLFDIQEPTGEPKVAAAYKKGNTALRVMQGEQHGRLYNLTQLLQLKQMCILTIGWAGERNPTNSSDIDIVENVTNYVSRFHATLEFDADLQQWYIRDGQWRVKDTIEDWYPSTNGVLVNSHRIDAEGFPIHPGDIITLGDTTLRVEII